MRGPAPCRCAQAGAGETRQAQQPRFRRPQPLGGAWPRRPDASRSRACGGPHCGFDCASQSSGDTEHLHVCIFAACVPCLAKYLFQSFAHLENGVIRFPTCGRSPGVWIRAPPLRVLARGVSCGGSRAASGSRRSAVGFPGRPLFPGPAGPMSCGRSGRPTFGALRPCRHSSCLSARLWADPAPGARAGVGQAREQVLPSRDLVQFPDVLESPPSKGSFQI